MRLKSNKTVQTFFIIGTFLLFVLIILLYYINHKPISFLLAQRMLSFSGNLICTLFIASLGGGIGKRILINIEFAPLVGLSIQAALGFGVTSVGVLIVGLLGWYKPLVSWSIALVLFLLFWRFVIGWWKDWRHILPFWHKSGRLGKVIALGVLCIFSLTLITASIPPIKYDALVYHLTLPRIYTLAERFTYVPDNIFWGMPQTGEMLYTLSNLLAGWQSAPILGWFIGVIALVGLLGFITQYLGMRAAWVGIASIIAGYSLASGMSWGYVDWLVILFGVSFIAAFDRWRKEPRGKYLVLIGAITGMAIATKYTAGVLLFSGVFGIVYYIRKSSTTRKMPLEPVIVFLFCVFLVMLPWLIKNLIPTGNPFYPLLYPSGEMDRFRLDNYQGGFIWRGWIETLFLPVFATITGVEMAPGYGASIGPLLLGFGVMVFLGWSTLSRIRKAAIIQSVLISTPVMLIWMVLQHFSHYLTQSRLYYVIFPALALLAGAGFVSLDKINIGNVRLNRLAGILVIIVLGLNLLELGQEAISRGALQTFLGFTTPEEYLANNLGWYYPAMQAIQELEAGDRVLMLWEPRSFYCLPSCAGDEIIDRWLYERQKSDTHTPRDTDEIVQNWQKAGFSYLLYAKVGADYVRFNSPSDKESDWQALDQMLNRMLLVQEFGGAYFLYQMNP